MSELYKRYLDAVEKTIADHKVEGHPNNLYEPIRYLMSLGGKRMRPLLVLLGYQLFKDDFSRALVPAVSVEMFHNFTLMHDDIMDNAPLRRGQATVHSKWDENTAILSGDVMLVKTYETFLQAEFEGKLEALNWFNRIAAEVCEGQQLDMDFESRSDVSISDYLEMIRLKTAVLLGFSLGLGAMVAEADKSDVEALYNFGELIGLGFQLKDDLLDAYATEGFGKQIGGDILANKKTFLTLKAMEKASVQQKQELEALFESSDTAADTKVQKVLKIYNDLSIRQETESIITSKFKKAYEVLDHVNSTSEKIQNLKDYSDMIMNRIK